MRALCDQHHVLMLADEIQSGLGRTGRTFACDHEGVVPDMYILGKALGGGLYPVSAVVADRDVLGVITPGSHGSTFGGNPMAAAIGREVVAHAVDRRVPEAVRRARAPAARRARGADRPRGQDGPRRADCGPASRSNPELLSGRQLCEQLMARGVLAKDTHGSTIRLAPPLVASEEDIDFLLEALRSSLVDAHSW